MKGLAPAAIVQILLLLLCIILLILFFPTILSGVIKFFTLISEWIIKFIIDIIRSIPLADLFI